ncbi:MAG TPA: EAL domain-containing protein, partial [Rhodocyclaceae bacterium]|nr:EAL domain-containing protein [Rhodocyclaceae bacterium]
AFGMTLLYTTVSRDVSTYRSVLAERLDNELAFITLTVTEQAVVGDYASLRRMLVLRTERADDIPMLTWRDARGNPISIESAAPVLRAPAWFAALIHMPDLEGRAPIDVGGVSYGEVTLQISPTPTVNRIWDDVKDGLQMLLLAASAIFGFIILVVTSALRPLNELSLFAKRFGEGDFAVRIPPSAMPELSPTISALNRMADDLHQLVGSLKQARATLSEEKERAQVTLASIADAVVTIDIAGRIEYVNPVAERLSGWTLDECRGQPVAQAFDLRNDDGSATADLLEHVLLGGQPLSGSGQAVLASRGGAGTLVEFSAAPIRDANAATVGAVIVVHDVSQTQKMATELSWQATHDSLTGLVNRREFERRLAAMVHRMQFEHGAHCFLYIDLDQFKIVNDTCGHIAGDELLRQICVLLQKQVRDADTLARLGGDEFGVLLGNCPLDQAMHAAEKMLDAVSNFRFVWQNNSYVVGLSIGLVPIIDAEQSMTSVMTAADAACYSAKERGRNRVHVYRPDDTELAQRQGEMQWVARITRAIETDRLCLYQQKIMPIGSNVEDGDHYEVLVRMRDETGALVPPMAFIPAAERYNMMPAVDRQIIRKAFDSFDRIYAPGSGRRLAQASINLSGNSLSDETFIHFIREQFATHAVSPTQICFEITETAAIANLSDAVGFIKELKQLGCRFSLDDFGSGLSSFAYLKSLPVDALKIDGSFVKDMPQDPIDTAMVRAINNIGHVMGLQTIAEFVENDIILGMLKEIGVDYAQGYGIARPVPLDDLAE